MGGTVAVAGVRDESDAAGQALRVLSGPERRGTHEGVADETLLGPV
jgi:hypothetical protein